MWIYILGSIGAGKTSLTKVLSADMEAPAYYEDVEGNRMIANMLQKFYGAGADSRKTNWGHVADCIFDLPLSAIEKAVTQENAIMDSSLKSDFVMASQLHKHGEIDDIDYNVYVTLSQEMQSNVNGSPWNGLPDLAVYLKIDPDHELDEIQSRGRDMEDIRQKPELVAYYRRVNAAYQDWARLHALIHDYH